jgi:DnaJ like chaperone protein
MTIWQRLPNVAAGLAKAGSVVAYLRGLAGVGTPVDPRSSVAFTIGFIALSAKMAKSDGVVTRDEVDAFAQVMRIPPEEAKRVRQVFDLAKQDVAGYEAYARQIAELLADDRALLMQVLEGLFVVAAADGVLHEREETYLRSVADIFTISPSEFRYVRALFVRDAGNPYEILGLSPASSDDEIKTRHRKLVLQIHPDKLAGQGERIEIIEAANRKLAAINAAFDTLRKERGL